MTTQAEIDAMSLDAARLSFIFEGHDNPTTCALIDELLDERESVGLDEARRRIDWIIDQDMVAEALQMRIRPDTDGVWPAESKPQESGWYECWRTDDLWSGKMNLRLWKDGRWWKSLADGGLITTQRGEYRWRGPVAQEGGAA